MVAFHRRTRVKELFKHPRVDICVQAIVAGGGHVRSMDTAVLRLLSGQRLASPHFNDHALTGKLSGLRSVVIGNTAENRSVVMVYRVTRQRLEILAADEHDAAYRRVVEQV